MWIVYRMLEEWGRKNKCVVRLEGIEPPLAVPKTAVLSIERQTQVVGVLYPSSFRLENFSVAIGKAMRFVSELLEVAKA